MPGYFGYIMILMMYVFAAGIVWLATAVLAVPKTTRPFAKRAALGMFFSFPGVFAYQAVLFPFAILYLLVGSLFLRAYGSDSIWLLVVIYGTAGWCLLASVGGFVAGWRAGWRLAGGESWRTVIVGDPLVGRTIAWLSRRIRWPDPPLMRGSLAPPRIQQDRR